MNRVDSAMKVCAAASLVLIVSCGPKPGNFCDVQSAPFQWSAETGRSMVKNDRYEAERLDAQNQYWSGVCR